MTARKAKGFLQPPGEDLGRHQEGRWLHWVGIGQDYGTCKWRFAAREDDVFGSLNRHARLTGSQEFVGYSVLLGTQGVLR